MDGAWRRPPKSLADYGHTEPKRGAEWWGKSVLLTFALFKSEPPSGRNPKWPLPQQWIYTQSNCVDCQAAFASKPAPTVGLWGVRWIDVGWEAVIAGKPAPTFGSRGCQIEMRWLAGRHRRQASSHTWIAGVSDRDALAGGPPSQASQLPQFGSLSSGEI